MLILFKLRRGCRGDAIDLYLTVGHFEFHSVYGLFLHVYVFFSLCRLIHHQWLTTSTLEIFSCLMLMVMFPFHSMLCDVCKWNSLVNSLRIVHFVCTLFTGKDGSQLVFPLKCIVRWRWMRTIGGMLVVWEELSHCHFVHNKNGLH
jgi:hypothetical protein